MTSEHGKKTRDGLLLSKFLRKIAEDACVNDPSITNAEALAKTLWKHSLGFTETNVDDEGNRKEVAYAPSLAATKIVIERIEGKVATIGEHEKNLNGVAAKVSEQGKDRIAKAGLLSFPKIAKNA